MFSAKSTSLLLLFLYSVALPACGPDLAEDASEEDDDTVIFERRRQTCDVRCGFLLDPECGADAIAFSDHDACLEHCMSEEAINWALQPDGSDACPDEMRAFYTCAANSSCEEQKILANTPALAPQTECNDDLQRLFECNRENQE